MDSTPAITTKVCPNCGSAFGCSPQDCWCSQLPQVMPMVDNAACYCPDCLKAIIDRKMQDQE